MTLGDIVRIKSGGPLMTVTVVEPAAITCIYEAHGELHTLTAPPAALVPVPVADMTFIEPDIDVVDVSARDVWPRDGAA